ncbi:MULTISPECIES: 50S ribosomal protein L9 [Brucella/Ochrobactrum group]|uniref:Large ribosomal subunit protein bL9 n=1 Tax=Brucella anthropi (strain ATCC 49188 / DSM 6882 / CCUG 24695 / JCM 21032 / LMG 3331 / NBRC 15819 / NCTC 12168 / Alc 37) TaxID=439375 RepID=RL9_BRUA4|nr:MULTISPECIES: 50S ribosomal protein L9 [Brucella/Ochrobactrum group]A6WWE3.1 RecName: Full=Large ribosomal subunit protein bL9; AltName: Full=50S ribosomal protein L9 [Brucella anthropi ATCC 49188]MCR5940770.1 50S ribosomal protein L9 [Ochrobactrum sp. XJ1]ABS13297.1 ribosomal protein L9 [Brucella anthropi ATCC 49188]AIK44146.1 ribosomal protein L9 [Brucella anthropi]KAB2734510.1 50S ribosomal protein L9 [Brucella anthropi]KAB2740751.1 50S ribosomal protein L9 [Brucella anthropi]
MEVILLERIGRLGQMGETVKVKDGYARNFLLPQGKALRANEANKKKFEGQRAQLEAQNLERKNEAQAVAEKLNGESFIVVRSAGETGQLYGSVSTRDIADIISANGFTLHRNQVELNHPIKAIGLHEVSISLHPEVQVQVTVNIARSTEEAERQAKGEDLTSIEAIYGIEEQPLSEEVFDEEDEAEDQA